MKHGIIRNILISACLVFLYFFAGHYFYVKDLSHSGIGLFIGLIFTGGLSAFLGTVCCILIMVSHNYWKSIVFISSGIVNMLVSWLLVPGINAYMLREDLLLVLLLFLPLFVLIWQVILAVKHAEKYRNQ